MCVMLLGVQLLVLRHGLRGSEGVEGRISTAGISFQHFEYPSVMNEAGVLQIRTFSSAGSSHQGFCTSGPPFSTPFASFIFSSSNRSCPDIKSAFFVSPVQVLTSTMSRHVFISVRTEITSSSASVGA